MFGPGHLNAQTETRSETYINVPQLSDHYAATYSIGEDDGQPRRAGLFGVQSCAQHGTPAQRHMSWRDTEYNTAGFFRVVDQERRHAAQLHTKLGQHDADASGNLDHRRGVPNHTGRDAGQFDHIGIFGSLQYANCGNLNQVLVDGITGFSNTGAGHMTTLVCQPYGYGFTQDEDGNTIGYQLQPYLEVSEQSYENIPLPVNYNGWGSQRIDYDVGRFDTGLTPGSQPYARTGGLNQYQENSHYISDNSWTEYYPA